MPEDALSLLTGLALLADELREAVVEGRAAEWDVAARRCQRLGARLRRLDARVLESVDPRVASDLLDRVRRAGEALETERQRVGKAVAAIGSGRRALAGYGRSDAPPRRGRLRRRA